MPPRSKDSQEARSAPSDFETAYPSSKRVYVAGPDGMRVPAREITLSGGEATYQMPFLHLFLKQVKSYDIHVCLETCGLFNREAFFDRIFPFIDLIYFDLKIFDEKLHMKYCGVSNKIIFENFTALLKIILRVFLYQYPFLLLSGRII